MARLIQAIQTLRTGAVRIKGNVSNFADGVVKLNNLFNVKEEIVPGLPDENGIITESCYRTRVTVGADTWVQDNDVEALAKVDADNREAIIEAVFGEFRSYFEKLNNAVVRKRPHEEISSIISKFEQQMFGDSKDNNSCLFIKKSVH
jgi:hypothetical protein